jgi:hypothetical protein
MRVTPAEAVVYLYSAWIPAFQAVSQLPKMQMLLFCHSGLDPESTAVPAPCAPGCRFKSGMKIRILVVL